MRSWTRCSALSSTSIGTFQAPSWPSHLPSCTSLVIFHRTRIRRCWKDSPTWCYGEFNVACLSWNVNPLPIEVLPTLLPPDHLLLDSAPNLGPLISCWEINEFKNCWYKNIRILEVLKRLFQKFLKVSSSERDMRGPRLGALSKNRWSGGTSDSPLSVISCIDIFLISLIISSSTFYSRWDCFCTWFSQGHGNCPRVPLDSRWPVFRRYWPLAEWTDRRSFHRRLYELFGRGDSRLLLEGTGTFWPPSLRLWILRWPSFVLRLFCTDCEPHLPSQLRIHIWMD